MSNEQEYPYPYPYYDEESGRVNCQICGRNFQVISPTHLKTHDLKYAEYKLRFSDAPLSSEEFAIKGLYGKNTGMFQPKEEDKFMGEEVLIEENEDLDEEEIRIEELGKIKSEPEDKIIGMKNRVYNHLLMYFSNVKMDYKIKRLLSDGRTSYEYITDFCDPVLMVVFDFPKTFWHNNDVFLDPLKHEKLESDGWRIVVINSRAPNLKDIENKIKGFF